MIRRPPGVGAEWFTVYASFAVKNIQKGLSDEALYTNRRSITAEFDTYEDACVYLISRQLEVRHGEVIRGVIARSERVAVENYQGYGKRVKDKHSVVLRMEGGKGWFE